MWPARLDAAQSPHPSPPAEGRTSPEAPPSTPAGLHHKEPCLPQEKHWPTSSLRLCLPSAPLKGFQHSQGDFKSPCHSCAQFLKWKLTTPPRPQGSLLATFRSVKTTASDLARTVALACHPRDSRGRSRTMASLRPAPAAYRDPISK